MTGAVIRHLGRESRAEVRATPAQLEHFRRALLERQFVAWPASGGRLAFRRRAFLLRDDWPMRVDVDRDGELLTIRYALYVPWAWIVGFVALMVLVLPFAGLPRADLVLVVGTIAAAAGIYRQRFDCRPDANYWQTEPRRRWGETMAELLEEAFGAGRPNAEGSS